MLSADWMRHLAMIAVCTAAAGCSVLHEPFDALRGGDKGAADASAKATAPVPGAAASAVATAASAPKAPAMPAVDPAVQHSFDAAGRAMRAGQQQVAEREFRALAQSHPDLGGPHANLGLIALRAGKPEQAVAELELAVKASPEQARYYNALGVAYRQQGQFTKARDAYEHAIALDAEYAAAVLNLGILNDLYLWDGPRALELYNRYLVLAPGGDATVTKWVADLKNRDKHHVGMLTRKETP